MTCICIGRPRARRGGSRRSSVAGWAACRSGAPISATIRTACRARSASRAWNAGGPPGAAFDLATGALAGRHHRHARCRGVQDSDSPRPRRRSRSTSCAGPVRSRSRPPMAGRSVLVRAPAKINLLLRVLERRADGFQRAADALSVHRLHDTLTVRSVRGPFQLECTDAACPADRTNLVWRAAERVWTAAGRTGAPRNVAIRLTKRIPMQAGLGGGSSDAAAALRVLGARWRVKTSTLRRIAASLGSDVPYFSRAARCSRPDAASCCCRSPICRRSGSRW